VPQGQETDSPAFGQTVVVKNNFHLSAFSCRSATVSPVYVTMLHLLGTMDLPLLLVERFLLKSREPAYRPGTNVSLTNDRGDLP
jgi:hypothetical protein